MWAVVSSQHLVSAALSSLLSFPGPPWGTSHRIQSFMSCLNMSLSLGLLFFKTCSNLSSFHSIQSFRSGLLQLWSPRAHSSRQKICSYVDSLWAAAFFRACFSLVSWCLPWSTVWISLLLCSFTDCRETTSVSMVFSTNGQATCCDACSISSLVFLTVLVSVGLFPLYFHYSSISQLSCSFFYSFLERVIMEIQPAPLMVSLF